MSQKSRTALGATVRAWIASPATSAPARFLELTNLELPPGAVPGDWKQLVRVLGGITPESTAAIKRMVGNLQQLIHSPEALLNFFNTILPMVLQSVASLAEMEPLAILEQRSSNNVVVTRRAAHALLCAGFLQLLQPNDQTSKFQRKLQGRNLEQLKCVVQYLSAVADQPKLLNGQFVISRQVMSASEADWDHCDAPMTTVSTVAARVLVGSDTGGGCQCTNSTISCCCCRELGGGGSGAGKLTLVVLYIDRIDSSRAVY